MSVDDQSFWETGLALIEAKQFAEAQRHFEHLVNLYPEQTLGLHGLWRLAQTQGDFLAQSRLLQALIQRNAMPVNDDDKNLRKFMASENNNFDTKKHSISPEKPPTALNHKIIPNVTLTPIEKDLEQKPGERGFLIGIFDQNKNFLNESALYSFERLISKCVNFDFSNDIKNRSLSIYGGIIFSYFGHFLLESLSRYWFWKNNPDIPIIFHSHSQKSLHPYQISIFQFLGIDASRIELVVEPVRFSSLILSDCGIVLGKYFHPDHLKTLGIYPEAAPYPGRKIWLSRSRLSNQQAKIKEEHEIETNLRDFHGYTIIYPENVEFLELLDLLATAEIISGFEGSAFYNLIFLSKVNARINMIARGKNAGLNFKIFFEAKKVSHAIYSVAGQVIGNNANKRVRDFSVDAPINVVRFIQQAENQLNNSVIFFKKRKLYIHCGLHKTGTTTLQQALRKNEEILHINNFLFPQSGKPEKSCGQHNLAWQMTNDRRYKPNLGTIEKLSSEIINSNKNIVISSEDFESSLLYPERWKTFLDSVKQSNIEIVFVIYLRDQISYMESLYQELLKAGFSEQYSSFCQKILEKGTLKFREWEFCFDYLKIAKSLSETSNVNIVFRNYHNLKNNSIIDDFFSIIGLDPRILTINFNNQANMRQNLSSALGLFYRNRIRPRRELNQQEVKAIAYLCNKASDTPVTTGRLRNEIEKKFSMLNIQHFFDGDHLRTTKSIRQDHMKQIVSMQKVFSNETQITICDISLLINKIRTVCDQALNREINEHVDAWWSKITSI